VKVSKNRAQLTAQSRAGGQAVRRHAHRGRNGSAQQPRLLDVQSKAHRFEASRHKPTRRLSNPRRRAIAKIARKPIIVAVGRRERRADHDGRMRCSGTGGKGCKHGAERQADDGAWGTMEGSLRPPQAYRVSAGMPYSVRQWRHGHSAIAGGCEARSRRRSIRPFAELRAIRRSGFTPAPVSTHTTAAMSQLEAPRSQSHEPPAATKARIQTPDERPHAGPTVRCEAAKWAYGCRAGSAVRRPKARCRSDAQIVTAPH